MARPPKITAPPGYKGCPKCRNVLPLIDPETQKKNFASTGYCKPCDKARVSAYKRQLSVDESVARGESPAAWAKREWQTEQFAMSYIPPFPTLVAPPPPHCECCHGVPSSTIAGRHFCERCAYYVAASGRCPEHSFREHVPELLGWPDAPMLPPREIPSVDLRNRPQLPDLDELDVEPQPNRA